MGLIKTFLSKNPVKFEQRGDAYFRNNSWGMAKLEYEKALDQLERTSPPDEKSRDKMLDKIHRSKEMLAQEHRENAENLMDQEYYDDARDLFELALTLTQDQGLISTIQNRLQEMDRLTVKDRAVDFLGLQGAEKRDDHDQGDEYFVALCGTLPKEVQEAYMSYGASFKAGYLALNQGQFEQALAYLSRALEENPERNTYILLELAAAYMNLGDLDEARRRLEAYINYHPDALPGYQLLCEIYWEIKAFEQAEALLDSCPDELKHSVAYHLLCGETMFHAGKYGEAVSFYQAFMKEYGWNEPAARALALTLEALGDLERALDVYGEIMGWCSSCQTGIDPLIKRKFADISYELGRQSTAILEMYLSLAQEDPDHAPLYYQKVSHIYASQGYDEEARRFQSIARQVQEGKD
jgi:tetratricopeptide (TPR) repeat protein